MEPLVLRVVYCRCCDRILGRTDGLRFLAGACVFAKPVTFACSDCGKRRVWVPLKTAAPAPLPA